MTSLRWRERVWCLPAAILFCWLAILGFLLPHDPDEAVYSVIARGIVDGRWPYRDLFDHKQPLVYLYYLPAGLGANIEVQRLIAAAATAASVIPFALLATRWLAREQARWAVIAYAALLGNPLLRVGANAEAFMLLPIAASFAASAPLPAGILLGAAIMTKPVAIVLGPVLVLIWRWRSWEVAAGAASVIAGVCVVFLPVWSDFWLANVSFNLEYARYHNGSVFDFLRFDLVVLCSALPLWLLAILEAVRVRRPQLVGFALCSLACVRFTGADFPHYYALLCPAAALFAGIGLDRVARGDLPHIVVVAPGIVAAALMIASVGILITGVNEEDELVKAAKQESGEFYLLGDRSQIYTQVGREPQRKYFYSVPLVIDEDIGLRVRTELFACPPATLVVSKNGVFEPTWRDSVAVLYARRREYENGTLYTEPYVRCEPPEG